MVIASVLLQLPMPRTDSTIPGGHHGKTASNDIDTFQKYDSNTAVDISIRIYITDIPVNRQIRK